ncbi:geranylgeranyl diphosphate synthase type II [Mycetocola sp. CAN_C7]|uniref:polyprenyl synthetase family protein n=1 Tax=Mycetocola sp. CAN_C7 TaxID=2787724 RepID=UPI0018CA3033
MTSVLTDFAGTDVHDAVQNRLDDFFDERISLASAYGDNYRLLWEAAREASTGGKRFRPALVVGVYRDLGGIDIDSALRVATAFELLHTAFLLHDDVIDQDLVRRGVPNLVGSFAADATELGATPAAARTWGEASAILAGDLLIQAAQGFIARLTVRDDIRSRLLDLFDRSVFVTAAGELADVAFSARVRVPSLADVMAMTEQKTASYSFEAPLKAGAILAGAGTDTLEVLGEFGRLAGIAFQLRDDQLGVFGDAAVTGKSVINDLRNGKETPLIAHARSTAEWPRIAEALGDPDLSDEVGLLVRATLEECGARTFVDTLIDDHVSRAVDHVDGSSLPETLTAHLREVARHAVVRAA